MHSKLRPGIFEFTALRRHIHGSVSLNQDQQMVGVPRHTKSKTAITERPPQCAPNPWAERPNRGMGTLEKLLGAGAGKRYGEDLARGS